RVCPISVNLRESVVQTTLSGRLRAAVDKMVKDLENDQVGNRSRARVTTNPAGQKSYHILKRQAVLRIRRIPSVVESDINTYRPFLEYIHVFM
ncbi:hypothetical protein ACJMK2_012796, partial [Sinanodonta woodiana]